MIIIFFFGILLIVLLIWVIGVYNSLIRLKVRATNAWSDIDIQLKRRYELIPNLVETVKGYASHERKTLEEVISARSKAMGTNLVSEKGDAENFLSGTLKSLFALSENYPQLRADQGFIKLQSDLSDIEETIASARRYYNAVVRDFNTIQQVFPNNMISLAFSFKLRDFFQLDSEIERVSPSVKL